MSSFRLLKRHEIDEQKWDALINQSANSLPYALTWYLDSVAENWHAVVYCDYEAVMPLVWLRKLGVKCLYQPYYCQQLGVFNKTPVGKDIISDLITFGTRKFAYADINFNPSASVVSEKFSMTSKKNLLLDLSRSYLSIRKLYAENHQRNIVKAMKTGLTFSENVELKAFQKFYLRNINPEKEKFKPKHAQIFKRLSATLVNREKAKVFAATDLDGELAAAVLMIFHGQRITGIINTSSAKGKKQGAAHYLFDRIIEKFSSQNYILDFEGSSIPGIARFYEGFGAQPETFYNYHYSLVKKAIKWFE